MPPICSDPQLQVGHYCKTQLILFVGEGNFAFSSMLATSFGLAPNIFATTIDTYDVFRARYGVDGVERVINLKSRGATVYFGIDITMSAAIADPSTVNLLSKSFDRIVFNYPHPGYLESGRGSFLAGFYDNTRHVDLIRNFFATVVRMLSKRCGEIHITHKTTVYKRWKFNRSARLCGLILKRSLLFVPGSFPGYVPCRGAGKNWFSTFPMGKGSRTYMYGLDWSQVLNISSLRISS